MAKDGQQQQRLSMESYQVIPDVQPRPLPEDLRPSFLGYALGYAFLTYMSVVMFVLPMIDGEAMHLALAAGVLVGGPLGLIICSVRLVSARENYARDYATKVASEIGREANKLLVKCQTEEQRLRQALTNADGWISHAEREYQQRAYGPFWEAIERTAMNLADVHDSVRSLRGSSQNYQSLLHGREHNFPSHSIRAPIPDPSRIVRKFQATLRKGQRDFEFATIWEQRATRRAVTEGFGSVGETVNSIGMKVVEDLAGLRSQVSEELHSIGDWQQETLSVLERQDRKLDNLLDRRSGSRPL
jgi:hypothetical protein